MIFATCDHQPLLTPGDQLLADALRLRGVQAAPLPWTQIDPYALVDAPPIVLRSTWDYHRMPTMFAAWLSALQDSGRAVWNPPAIALANADKIYLQQLASTGVAIPDTRWLDCVDASVIRRALDDQGWSRAVLKPRIAATAYGTHVVTANTELTDEELRPARASGALLQAFVPEVIDRGEISLVYCDGSFTHAVIKRPSSGDFRVQMEFGGSAAPHGPTPEILAFGDRVLATLPGQCLYARVDIVESSRGPLLMELELIEPELYFTVVPSSAELFADAIVKRLS